MPGDAVLLASGTVGVVWWIGTRDFLPALLPAAARRQLAPIRLAPDLFVSPFLRLPRNGASVQASDIGVPCMTADPIRYVHLELAVPSVLLAQGVEAESYRDAGDRNLFGNVATHVAAPPALADHDPDIHLRADGARIEASRSSSDEVTFEVPGAAKSVVIASRSLVPATVDPAFADKRRLGICLLGIVIRVPGRDIDVPIGDTSLREGFHAFEAGARWTDGAGVLPPRFFATLPAGFTLILRPARTPLPYGKATPPPTPPRAPGSRHAPRRLSSSARALVIDASVPTPDRDAGSNVILWHMRLLRRLGLAVTFLPLNLTLFPGYTEALWREGIATVETPAHQTVEAFLRDNAASFDLAYIHRFQVAEACLPALRRYALDTPVLFNPADLHHLRLHREAELLHAGHREAEQARARELAVIAAVDLTILCNTVERTLILDALPEAAIRMLPWVIETPAAPPPPFPARSGIMFLGGFNHAPNVDAVRWFASDVLDALHGLRPDATLHVYGADVPPAIAALARPGLVIAGHVADLGPAFDRHRMMVAPLRYGAGFKGKIAEALARGLPVVATSIAVEGSGLVPGEHLLTADSAFGIAAALAQLDQDEPEWMRLSEAGRAFALEHLSPERGLAHLKAALRQVGLISRNG